MLRLSPHAVGFPRHKAQGVVMITLLGAPRLERLTCIGLFLFRCVLGYTGGCATNFSVAALHAIRVELLAENSEEQTALEIQTQIQVHVLLKRLIIVVR